MNFSNSSVVSFTEGFPPAHKLVQTLTEIDYVKHLNNFMEAVEIMIAIALIVGDVARYVWDNGGKETVIDICQKVYLYGFKFMIWFVDTFIPAVENAIQVTYDAGMKARQVWDTLNSPMFISI